jgi:hypothetical protein
MSPIKRAFLAASLVVVANGAQAETVTTYIGGPKSGITQRIDVGNAKAIVTGNGYLSYAQTVPVRQRVVVPGGVQAIGADSAYEPAARQGAFRAVPARRSGASGPTSGAKAIGSDN